MPQYQLDLILADSEIMMEAQANKDINTEKLGGIHIGKAFTSFLAHQMPLTSNHLRCRVSRKLVKMAGSLMNSVSGVNENLEHIMKEESRDPLWLGRRTSDPLWLCMVTRCLEVSLGHLKRAFIT